MRLNSLHLTRYGRFTDHVLDFGAPAPGRPDLHLIYGPNEAGKSTALSAFLDLLFGIEPRSRYGFRHPYPTMRIGASLGLPEGSRELIRVKRLQNSLLDGNERPVPETILGGALGGLDREAYRMRFSLDDHTLETGGESILASKGDLGELLFSASAGLADLSRSLSELKAEAEGFYKLHARKGGLRDLKDELAALKEEQRGIDVAASEYARLRSACEQAQKQYEEADAERGQLRARIEEIQRHLRALPRLSELVELRARLLPLAELREPPLGWTEALPALQAEAVALQTRRKSVEEEIARLTDALEAIAVDDDALKFAARADDLADLRARHVAAETGLSRAGQEHGQAALKVSHLLARLGREQETEPARLILDAASAGALRALIDKRSRIAVKLEAAQQEEADAAERLDDARNRLDDAAGSMPIGRDHEARMAALSAAVAAQRGSDHSATLRRAERDSALHAATLRDRLAELHPWTGEADALAGLPVPLPADLDRWERALTEADQQIGQSEEEAARLDTERRLLEAELAVLGNVAGVVSDADAAKARGTREAAWAEHRRSLDAASADAFETALRRDDVITDSRMRHEKEIGRLHELTQTLAKLDVQRARYRERLEAAAGRRKAAAAEIAGALAAIELKGAGEMSLPHLRGWLSRREKALEVRASLRQADRDLEQARKEGESARGTLADALAGAGISHDPQTGLETLLATAEAALAREAGLKVLREALKERERDVKTRARELAKARDEDERWLASWTAACSACWLGEGGEAPSVEIVSEVLTVLAALAPALEKQAELVAAIHRMESDQAAFTAEVAGIAGALGLEVDPAKSLDAAARIGRRIQEARAAQVARAKAAEELERARARLRGLAEEQATHDARSVEMMHFFGVDTLGEVGAKLQDATTKADLRSRVDAATRDLLAELGAPSVAVAETMLADADRAALDAELAQLRPRADDQDQRVRDLFSNFSKASDRLDAIGGDDAAARIEERRRTTLLDIEERAHRHLRLRAGIIAAEHALRAYRDKHRGSMMSHASQAFRTLSRGAYSGLTTQLDRDQETLIATAADGSSKIASELSKGTRFQLYLALRVAGYYEFTETRRPVPFVADDIMETFDDFRAEEAFGLFAGMAQRGQVIYLTHHRHLCEIARRICPDIRIHDLSRQAA
jgi:uncharacterized protein YhaN